MRRVHVHLGGVGGDIGQNLSVHTRFDLAYLRVGDGRVVRKVKTRAIGIHQAAFLLHMRAQHVAQREVHQVRGAVVAHGRGANKGVDLGGDGIANLQRAMLEFAVVAEHIGADFQGVVDQEFRSG